MTYKLWLSVRFFYSNDLSLNPAEVCSFHNAKLLENCDILQEKQLAKFNLLFCLVSHY